MDLLELFEPAKVLHQQNFEAALALAACGIAVFPCVPQGDKAKAPGKECFWRSESSSDEHKVRRLWSKWPNSMPGIDVGKSGWLVIDCDVKRANGITWFIEYAAKHNDDLSQYPYVETPSGGRHYIFKNPDQLGNSRGVLPPKAIADIDVRGKGGYIIGAGAVLTDGMGAYVANGDITNPLAVPLWLHELLSPPAPSKPPIFIRVDPSELDQDRLSSYGQEALEQEMRDLANKQPGERNEGANLIAFRIGQLVGGGCVTYSEAYQALEQAALSWGIRPNDRVLGPKGTIARALRSGEKSPRGPQPDLAPTVEILLDGSVVDSETGEVLEDRPPQPEGELPDYLTRLPGLLGSITDYICDTALYPQRGLALGAALTIVGTAAGRHLAGPTRSGTHLYVIGLAPSGAGKDHALSMIAPILTASGLGQHVGPSQFISMPAVINFIVRTPLSVCPMDEFGSFLKRINNRRASGFEGAISGVLRTAWGLSFKTMTTPEWAQKASERVASPAMSIFGVSTAREFYDSLEGGDVTNGVLNRFLVIETKIRPAEQVLRADPSEVPANICHALKAIYNSDPIAVGLLCQSRLTPGYTSLGIDPDAEQIRRGLVADVQAKGDADPSLEPFLARTAENAIRLATIAAIGQGVRVINAQNMNWAREFAMWSSNRIAEGAGLYIADSDSQATANGVRRAIQERGGRIKRRDLIRALAHKYKTRDLDDALKALAEAEQIQIEKTVPAEQGGRPSLWYSTKS